MRTSRQRGGVIICLTTVKAISYFDSDVIKECRSHERMVLDGLLAELARRQIA